jgi:hypothetical protein
MPLLAGYAVLVVPQLPSLLPLIVRAEPLRLVELAELLGKPEATLLAWIHFLAFDLFVGRWIYRDGYERFISAWLMSPVLVLALLLGPLGLLTYLLIRTQFRLADANRT